MSSLSFDASTVAPSTGFDPLPAGDYTVIAESAELKPTKNGNGKYIEVVFVVVSDNGKGRKLWNRITFENPSEKAQSIGRAQLSALCRAVGVMNLNDTAQLLNRPCLVTVGHERRDDNGELQNVIKKYHIPAGNVAGAVVAGSSKPAQAAAATPPWKK